MQPFISRSVATERVFPPITPDLYKPGKSQAHLTSDQSLTRTLLASSAHLPLSSQLQRTRNARYFLNHALFTHRSAFESELAGELQRADYFWDELYAELKFSERQDVWPKLAQSLLADQPQLKTLGEPSVLRSRLV